jgi:hypothetical protein
LFLYAILSRENDNGIKGATVSRASARAMRLDQVEFGEDLFAGDARAPEPPAGSMLDGSRLADIPSSGASRDRAVTVCAG